MKTVKRYFIAAACALILAPAVRADQAEAYKYAVEGREAAKTQPL